MVEFLNELNPETWQGLVMITAVLAVGIPITLSILFKQINQFTIIFGACLGIVLGNILAMGSPAGVLFFITETVIAVILVGGWILTSTYRHVEVLGYGSSHEAGLGWWGVPESPIERAIGVKGQADALRLEGASRVIDATNRLEQARHERLLLKEQVRSARYLGPGDPEQAYRDQLAIEAGKAHTRRT